MTKKRNKNNKQTKKVNTTAAMAKVVEKNFPKRTYEEEIKYLSKINSTLYKVEIGFVPNMKVPAYIIVNDDLERLLLEELQASCGGGNGGSGGGGGFLPALKQVSNVAALPGIVKGSFAMPDVHSGYGFCIGNVAAFDMDDDDAVVSPGGVGFDINCGVRLIRTNLMEDDIPAGPVREGLCQALFDHIPVGVGQDGVIPLKKEREIDDVLRMGIDWAIREGYAWPEDKEHCEENGRMATADPKHVSNRAKKRGKSQLGTLGAGNHYVEVQVIEHIYDDKAAKCMGLHTKGQVCVMIHTGSRGLGHQVATDALMTMESVMARDGIQLNDRQLSCARIQSKEGQEYIKSMSAAANYAWANRSCITYLARRAFTKAFPDKSAEDMDMHLIYDVCHNVAKIEKHVVNGSEKTLLVHRKGSTRAFPPHHPSLPKNYKDIGQPILIGGTMGTCSYVLAGTTSALESTFGSTCHGAGRALSRNASRRKLNSGDVLKNLKDNGISIRVASPKLVMEEAPESYKDVIDVVETCEKAGISRMIARLRPIAVVKG